MNASVPMTRSWWRLIAVLSLFLLVLASCAETPTDPGDIDDDPAAQPPGDADDDDEWGAIVAAAKEEGRVVLYTALSQPTAETLKVAFEDAYPEIELEFLRESSGALIARVEQEKEQGIDGADVIWTPEVLWFRGQEETGDLLPIVGPHAEEWSHLDVFLGTHVIATILPLGIAWNTNEVDEPLTSYEDLLRPELQGRIGAVDVTAGTGPITTFVQMQDSHGDDFLERLAEQDVRLFESVAPLGGALGAGEIAVSSFMVVGAIGEGAPIEFTLPEPAAVGAGLAVGALGWATRPNAARVLIDFALSDEGQVALHAGEDNVSPLGDSVPGSVAVAGEMNVWNLEPERFDSEFVTEFTEEFNRIFRPR